MPRSDFAFFVTRGMRESVCERGTESLDMLRWGLRQGKRKLEIGEKIKCGNPKNRLSAVGTGCGRLR